FRTWLEVEILVCEALAKKNKIPPEVPETIRQKARIDVESIKKIEATTRHDVVAFLRSIAEQVGPVARYIHMGLTSSDVVDTALSALMLQSAKHLIRDVQEVISILEQMAITHKNTIMMGRTHGVHAEPVTLGLKFLNWREEMLRNRHRLDRARESIAVGKISGAVGTYAHIDPSIEVYVCKRLGLKPARISTQVLQRDRHAEFLSAIAICGSTVEKIATEIRNLQRTEIREIEEPFAVEQTGSSAMPHKRNPVSCEQLCGLARVLRANLFPALENISLWHERDISHSSVERIIIPDSTILLDYMSKKLSYILSRLHIYTEKMQENLQITKGLIFSQSILLYLIDKGASRETAYEIIKRNAMKCWQTRRPLRDILLADKEATRFITPEELDKIMNYEWFLTHIDYINRSCGLGR
ncbi:adenylosuccinate lyase, partial [Candidatus Sumerlaeota bacterium]|nr:adenylosuccinate lyase [Candidatus Sumerlaeota bacterium]